MATKNNGPVIDDWTEYKRLVLSELERLNQAVNKLKDQCVEIQGYIQTEINRARETLYDQIITLDKNTPSNAQIDTFKKQVGEFEKRFSEYEKEQQRDSIISNKWGFWTAVVSIIGSLISIISLIVALG